eukprot:460691-Pyramimonas_sp.AAC.1
MACTFATSQAVLRSAAVDTRGSSARAAPAPIAHLASKQALGGNALNIARQADRAQTLNATRSTARRSAMKVVAAISKRPWSEHNARLVLKDGTVFTGIAFGATGTVVQEVVFNTSLSGCAPTVVPTVVSTGWRHCHVWRVEMT